MGCFFLLFPSPPPSFKVPIPILLKKDLHLLRLVHSHQARSSVFLGSDSVNRELLTTPPTTLQSRVKEKSHSLFPRLESWLRLCWGKSLNSWPGPKRHFSEEADCFTCFHGSSSNPGRYLQHQNSGASVCAGQGRQAE